MLASELLADWIQRHKDKKHHFNTNEWLYGDDLDVYVRKSIPRTLNSIDRYVCLEIANIQAHQKGQGYFTKFLEKAESFNPWDAIYIENVLEPRLERFLIKQGYTKELETIPSSYYKLTLGNKNS